MLHTIYPVQVDIKGENNGSAYLDAAISLGS